MIIHVVKSGETVSSIADLYGITSSMLISVNELPNPDDLAVGQSLAIRVPEITHTAVAGDTLDSIASSYGVTTTQILQNNPRISVTGVINSGELIVIKFSGEEPIDDIVINGYAYPFIDRTVLKKTLPFLTYLSIFTYGFTPDGDLVTVDDEELISIAKDFGVAPVMMLAPMNESNNFDSDIAHQMFGNGEERLIENIVSVMQQKGYRGLDIDFEFILPEDKDAFRMFVTRVHNRLTQEGLLTFVALAPKTSGEMTGLLYEAHDYKALGAVSDYVLLMTYEWGYLYSSPMATAPINNVIKVVEYGSSVIDPDKLLLGIPNYAYDWALPYVKGTTVAEALSNQEAVERAAIYNAIILFDELGQVPYFFYTNENGTAHVVWFDDVRSMEAKMKLIPKYGFAGAGIWQIMNFFPGLWNVVGAYFTVKKV